MPQTPGTERHATPRSEASGAKAPTPAPAPAPGEAVVANTLAAARSAYLQSAAHQPTHWLEWGPEAFSLARRLDRPVLVDVGAVWCHWCHVMDGESYEDPAVAEVLNRDFVCVKVDRDERPDVDARLQRTVGALTGSGGWPLTAFLTPDARVFYGGTYFPPTDAHGRPGFRTLLAEVARLWKEKRGDLLESADRIRQELAERVEAPKAGAIPGPDLLLLAGRGMSRQFDPVNGGFGDAPKFPHPGACSLAWRLFRATGDDHWWHLAEKTLRKMALGGIHDQLAGGFHRYSVDERWVVPHFEKMSYDNAELLRAYVEAWATTKEPLFEEVARGIVRWVLADAAGEGGIGFAASQDADVVPDPQTHRPAGHTHEDVIGAIGDGDHFTWTVREAKEAISDEKTLQAVRLHFDLHEKGEMHHDTARNVLWVARDRAAIADELGLGIDEVDRRLVEGKALLRKARAKRPVPFVDRTLYASWNALMADAFLHFSTLLGDPKAEAHALAALEFLWSRGWREGEGIAHHLRADQEGGEGYVDDQVFPARAFLTAHLLSGDAKWLERSVAVTRAMLAHFADPATGALRDRRPHGDDPLLDAPVLPIQDAPTPSGNGAAALHLLRLARLTGDPEWERAAERILALFASEAPRLNLFAATYLLALDERHHEPAHVVIAGPPGSARDAMLSVVRRELPFGATWEVHAPGATPANRTAQAIVKRQAASRKPLAFVCRGGTCHAPVDAPEDVARLLSPATGRETL